MRRAAKTDGNQTPMVDALRGAGLHVVDTHALGSGFPDLVVVAYNLRTDRIDALLVEVKTDKGKLTPDERVFHDAFPQGGPLLVARDILSTAAERGWEPAQVRREAWVRKQTSHIIVKSELSMADATEIDDVPFNHMTRANGTTPVDLYEQQPETLTIPRLVTRGRIECRNPHDPQAHVELTVDGRTLYLEYQGSFVQFELPKEYGIYRRSS